MSLNNEAAHGLERNTIAGETGSRIECFPTSIWRFQLEGFEALNGELASFIQDEQERDPVGLKGRSTLLGWHSANHLHRSPEMRTFVSAVETKIAEVVSAYRVDDRQARLELSTCWALVNGRHASGAAHCHPNAFLSGVYYVSTTKESGAIHFLDPRPAAQMAAAPVAEYVPWTVRQVSYQPPPGAMLIFPSWLHHSVGPNLSDAPRISISFNYQLVFS